MMIDSVIPLFQTVPKAMTYKRRTYFAVRSIYIFSTPNGWSLSVLVWSFYTF